jgi:hypothetical protein
MKPTPHIVPRMKRYFKSPILGFLMRSIMPARMYEMDALEKVTRYRSFFWWAAVLYKNPCSPLIRAANMAKKNQSISNI